jgi:hypothetical protein
VKKALNSQTAQWRDGGNVDHEMHVFIAACYDNSQKNTKFKFQQDGKTSNFVKVMARMFVKVWQGTWHLVPLADGDVTIMYVHQSVPSCSGGPMYAQT